MVLVMRRNFDVISKRKLEKIPDINRHYFPYSYNGISKGLLTAGVSYPHNVKLAS
jgi:hypothetical protein